MKTSALIALQSFFLALPLLTSCAEQDVGASGGALLFGAIPDQSGTDLSVRFAPVSDYLEDKLGVPVEFVPSDTYESLIAQFKNGDVHLAWFGGLSGAQARAAVEGSRAIAQGKADPTFVSYFIANASIGVEPSDDFPLGLEGHKFTFGGAGSTSGRLMPEYFIRKETGKTPEEFFGMHNNYSGSHNKTAELVQAGTFEAGAINYKLYDSLVLEGKIDPEVCRKIWTTPQYADYNWTAHPSLDEVNGAGFIDRLQAALVEMDSEEILESMYRPEGMIPASNEEFESIREIAVDLDLLR